MTCTLPTPAQVKNLPFSAALVAVFAPIDDAKIQELIDNVASWFGSPEVKRHTLRCEIVKYGAAHLLWLSLKEEGALPGQQPGVGIVSGQRLEGVGSINFAVAAINPNNVNDWLQLRSPFSIKLNEMIKTLPPGICTASGWGDDAPPEGFGSEGLSNPLGGFFLP